MSDEELEAVFLTPYGTDIAGLRAVAEAAWDEGAKALLPILSPGMEIVTHNPYREGTP